MFKVVILVFLQLVLALLVNLAQYQTVLVYKLELVILVFGLDGELVL
jgi:hypothetical protein